MIMKKNTYIRQKWNFETEKQYSKIDVTYQKIKYNLESRQFKNGYIIWSNRKHALITCLTSY